MNAIKILLDDKAYADLKRLAAQDDRELAVYAARAIRAHLYGLVTTCTDQELADFRSERKRKHARITIKASVRKAIYDRDGGHCRHCNGPVHAHEIWHVDHFIPLAKGGTNDIENLVLSCARCNVEKRDKLV